jgi:hypothetical protein
VTGRFAVGSVVQRREVLHGQVWLSAPARVIADDDVLALWIGEGTPFTFPPHPFGTHPWSHRERWEGTGVLQLQRPGEAHAVWGFFRGRVLDHWYVNFQAPYRRGDRTVDTLDFGLDIVVRDDRWEWKDREDVAAYVDAGRLTPSDAAVTWDEAQRVASALDDGRRWWSPRWGAWRPDPSWPAPG